MSRYLSMVLVFSLLILPAVSQTPTTGAVVGTVYDATGAVSANASVTIMNSGTGAQRTTSSNAEGVYRFGLLEPGAYAIEVSSPSFKTQRKTGIVVHVAESETLNFTMQIGRREEKVEVAAGTELVQTESTTLGGLVGQRTIDGLPLTTRNYTQVLDLSPGVQADVTNAGTLGRNTQDVYVNGSRSIDNNFQMDGAEVNNFGTNKGGDWLGYTGIPIPNPDAIQEFKVQTSLFDAGYGRGVGANVNVITKSGTNSVHGTLFEFFRNDALNANDFFLNRQGQKRPVLRQNQFGATLGGPLVKDKLFIFGSYQGTRQTNGVGASSLQSVVLPPLTNDRLAATLGAQFCGQSGAFGGASVACDGSNINPVALALLNYKLPNGQYIIPTPQTIDQNGQGFSVFSVPSVFTEDQGLLNVDYVISKKHTLGGHFFYSRDPQNASFTTSNTPGSGATTDFQNRVFNLKLTSVLTNSIVNEARFSWVRNFGNLQTLTPVKDSDIFMTQPADQPIIPVIQVQSSFSLGGQFNDIFKTTVNSFQYGDQLSINHGRHNFRMGGQFERVQENFDLPGIKRGLLFFLSFPDFLLGQDGTTNGSGVSNVFESAGQSGLTDRQLRVNNLNAFIQDDFKVTPQLTLNLGLRWEMFGGASEARGRMSNFYPSLADNDFSTGSNYTGFVVANNFSGTIPPGVAKVGNDTCCASSKLWKNFGPRIGLAWRPIASTNRFVVRAGYGLFYSRTSGNDILQVALQPPYAISFFNVAAAAPTFQDPWQPAPPPASAYPIFLPRTPGGSLSIENLDKDFSSPRTHQWSVNAQYEIVHDLLWQVGYVGTRGERLLLFRYISQSLLASPQNPVNGEIDNTVENAANRVPYQGFGPLGILQMETKGNSKYHGLQTSLTKRFAHGLQFQVAYTFSRTEDDVPIAAPGLSPSGTGFNGVWGGILTSDQNDRRKSWGLADFDRTHRFVVSYLWDIPAFNRGAFLHGLTSNWTVSGVTTVQSGNALSVYDPNSGSIYGQFFNRAQVCDGFTGSIASSGSVESRLDHYINAAAFCAPAAIGDGFDFGTSQRGIVRGPGQHNYDIALSRRFPLRFWRDTSNLEFRAEFFNAFNHPQFADPLTSFQSTPIQPSDPFGKITATSVTPRILQFALKFAF